jgi:hypothetical protein
VAIPQCARHLKLMFFESPLEGSHGAASQQHPGKRDLNRRETSLSAGESQRKILKQLLHVMVSRRDRRKVSS